MLPGNNSPEDLDFTMKKERPVIDPVSGKSIEELKAKRGELSQRLQGKREGEDWKAELELDLVQDAIKKITLSEVEEGEKIEEGVLYVDRNLADRIERPRTLQ